MMPQLHFQDRRIIMTSTSIKDRRTRKIIIIIIRDMATMEGTARATILHLQQPGRAFREIISIQVIPLPRQVATMDMITMIGLEQVRPLQHFFCCSAKMKALRLTFLLTLSLQTRTSSQTRDRKITT
jgi:hypothetical protein